ncbi:MAG: endonuclease MutS2 [Desulfovibrionaceae bacterium CG1_02_65_16]|nr:MAG: endonuclease MutS2 [Desulfovibrionaceae bacterium CG1_02_65_16]
MESRTLHLLEFPKVLRELSGFAVSEPGAAACLALGPLATAEAVRGQLALLDQTLRWVGESGFHLATFPDFASFFPELDISHRILDLDALFALSLTLEQARHARDLLEPYGERGWDELFEVVAGAPWPQASWSGLKRCLDQDGRLKDESSPGLFSVRQEIRGIHQKCSKRVKDFVLAENISHYLQDDYITISSDRYVLPLKVNFKNRFPGIIHDYSQTGETCYFEPMFLVEINNTLQELKREERAEERKVLEYLTGLVRQERPGVVASYESLVQIDLLMAKARLAEATNARALDIGGDVPARLLQARHPLLALHNPHTQPLDIKLQEGQLALIVSGGNAGGKTVCLKTMGLIALMAFSGLPVPVAEGSSLPLWTNIFVVLGDEQSLEEHVSTFTAQIQYIARVWDHVDDKTLFLLDEFGAGTDPTQGAALAQAVIDGLLDRGATSFAATHFPALKAYALATERVRAASVLFDPKTKRPLFRLAYDQVGASIALDVAREHGLPRAILSRAEQYLLLDGNDTSAVLDRLNSLAVRRERENDALVDERAALRKKRDGLEARYEKERVKLLGEVREQAQTVLREWKSERIGRKQALKKLSEVRERLEPAVREDVEPAVPTLDWADLTPGQRVCYKAWSKTGVVLERDERKRQVKVDFSGVAMWVAFAELTQDGKAARKAERSASGGAGGVTAELGYTPRIDLRGQRSDEALAALAQFLDASLLRGASGVEIVHGRGTGALRKEIHAYLRTAPGVASFTLATEDRGGDGMTEATLK